MKHRTTVLFILFFVSCASVEPLGEPPRVNNDLLPQSTIETPENASTAVSIETTIIETVETVEIIVETTVQTSTTYPQAPTLELLVSEYFAEADRQLMLEIAFCESSAQPGDTTSNATNKASGAAGWFQHLPKFWEERSTRAGFFNEDIYSPRANVGVAAYLVYETPQRFGHWSESAPCWQ